MKENQSSKKKALSEDELLDVTGGDLMMRLPDFGPRPCNKSKDEKGCNKKEHCKWNTTISSCEEKPDYTGKQMAT